MRKLVIRFMCAFMTFGVGLGAHQIKPTAKRATPPIQSGGTTAVPTPALEPRSSTPVVERTTFADLLTEDEAIHYNGCLIERLYKSIKFDERLEEDQGYVVISKGGKRISSFDAWFYHPGANFAEFGLFSFLGKTLKQVAISQTVSRGGTQWIVDVSARPRVIFDGDAWGVGREAADCEVKDFNGDGIFEISLPITDFYTLMDKMTVGGVPLPVITFKYDSNKRGYFPVNHILNQSTDSSEPDLQKESNELYFRSAVLSHMLDLIYVGKRVKAWQYFDRAYNLDDKQEFERRVKRILRDQPVYKFIYKNQ